MQEMITIRLVNDNSKTEVAIGSTLWDIYNLIKPQMKEDVIAAKVNNITAPLSLKLYSDKTVEFLDLTSSSGERVHTRSIFFILGMAIKELYGIKSDFNVEASISSGYYCSLNIGHEIFPEDIDAIKTRMREIMKKDLPFVRKTETTEDAIKRFAALGLESRSKLLKYSGLLYCTYYMIGEYPDTFYSALLKSTGQIKGFDLMRFHDGILVRIPDPKNPRELKPLVKQEKMLDVFRRAKRLQRIVRLRTIGDLNEINTLSYTTELINASEAIQEKQIVTIAEQIEQRPHVRLVLIAGPSSSGKTTFSKRLSIQLMACGIYPQSISMDDYFVDRDKTPRDENGEYDYESIDALNLPLLSEHLQDLFNGKEIELQRYNFITGMNEKIGKKMKLTDRSVIIMEGIHALNPKLTEQISDLLKYKIYVSALTTILIDEHNHIPTTDNRLLRRIVRDYKYRNYSAQQTINRWPSVTAGEKKWIYPYQENADAMFNSSLLFELAGLKNQALPLLETVPENVPEYSEAYRLKKFLSYIRPLPIDKLPLTSLLREFLGGSSFHY